VLSHKVESRRVDLTTTAEIERFFLINLRLKEK